MATSGKQLSSLPSASSIAGNNEFLTWVGNDTAQKVSRDDFIKSLPTYRQPSTAYTVGQIAYHASLPTGYYLECTTAGTTTAGDITPSSTIGGTVTDGTVTWTVRASQQTIKDFSYKGNNAVNFLSDCNDADEQGIFAINGDSLNIPQTDFYGMLINLKNRALPNTCQIAGQAAGTSIDEYTLWTRYKNSSGWKNWKQIDSIVAKSLGKIGYIKYASGLIMQWGILNVRDIATGSKFRITFPITFSVEPGVLIVPDGGYNSFPQITYEGVTTSGMTGFIKSGTSINLVHWFAIGH